MGIIECRGTVDDGGVAGADIPSRVAVASEGLRGPLAEGAAAASQCGKGMGDSPFWGGRPDPVAASLC